ncbi:MAG: hypothetical protein PHE56_00600 [Bacteroidales bacterium]|nr:hypothetical protein [Bacteroidales bacterium]
MTNTKKLRLLLAVVVIFAFVSYQLAISDTISSYKACVKLEEQYDKAKDAPQKMQVLKTQLNNLNQEINCPEDINFQEQLLKKITAFKGNGNIVLRELPEPIYYKEQDLLVETQVVKIEGGFHDLLKLLNEMETDFNYSKVSSAGFEIENDYKNNRLRLSLKIYFQNIKIYADEK